MNDLKHADNVDRQPKHIEIDNSLERLNEELNRANDFIAMLVDDSGPERNGKEVSAVPSEPSFLNIYNGVSERVNVSVKRLQDIMQQFRDMLI